MADAPWAVLVIDANVESFQVGRNRLEIWPNGAAARTRFLKLVDELELVDVSTSGTIDEKNWGVIGFTTDQSCVVEVVPVTIHAA